MFLSALLPAPDPGDMLNLGTTDGTDMTVDGAALSGEVDAWPLAGCFYTTLRNANFRNFPRHGIYLSAGATGNLTYDVRIENCGGTGVFFDQNAVNNILKDTKVTGSGLNGLHMTGEAVKFNDLRKDSASSFSDNARYGVLIEDGASCNLVCPGRVVNNRLEGVMIRGEDTDSNVIGRNSLVVPASSEAYANGAENGGAGICLGPGMDHTLIRYAHVAGNAGDGILLEGPGCAYNQIQSVSTGLDLSSKQSPIASPNGANGIHLKDGDEHNLIGGRLGGMFGWRNAIAGNSENGILIEGAPATIPSTRAISVPPRRRCMCRIPIFRTARTGSSFAAARTTTSSAIGTSGSTTIWWPTRTGPGFSSSFRGLLRGDFRLLFGQRDFQVKDSSGNAIGDAGWWAGNEVVDNHSGGILVTGTDSFNNKVQGNYVGVDRRARPNLNLGNNGPGVRLDLGAAGNLIGGEGRRDDSEVPGAERHRGQRRPGGPGGWGRHSGQHHFLQQHHQQRRKGHRTEQREQQRHRAADDRGI